MKQFNSQFKQFKTTTAITRLLALCFALISSICCFNFASVKHFANPIFAASSSAKAMCVLDKDSKRILYCKNQNESLPMASTTKVVTAITVLENCKDLNQVITINKHAVGVEGTSIYLRQDEQISVMDLLYGLMLRSGNDSATALAYHVGGSVDGFASLMNNFAKKVGAKNSHFANPHGLDNPNHYTTAYDLALITCHALNNPTFKQIVSTKNHIISATNKSDKRYLTNKNRLLSSLTGCCGVKTGFTSKAGRCLVSACERDNRTTVCVVLNCGPMFEESVNLIESSFEDYSNKKVVDKNKEIYNEYLLDDKAGRLYLYAEKDVYCPIKQGEEDKIQIKYSVKLDDAHQGSEVGKIDVFLDNQLINSAKLYTMNKIEKFLDNKTLQIKEILWEEEINEN